MSRNEVLRCAFNFFVRSVDTFSASSGIVVFDSLVTKKSPDSLVNVMNLRSDYNSVSVTYIHLETNVASDTHVGLYFQSRMFEEYFPWYSVRIQHFCDLGQGGCGDCYRVHACAN